MVDTFPSFTFSDAQYSGCAMLSIDLVTTELGITCVNSCTQVSIDISVAGTKSYQLRVAGGPGMVNMSSVRTHKIGISSCNFLAAGWELVREVLNPYGKWHPATDDLAGT